MKLIGTILFFLLLLGEDVYSQIRTPDIQQIEHDRNRISKNGSISLAIWSGINISVGTIGYLTQPKNEWTYFQEMNVFWNIVNLGLAIPGILIKEKKQASIVESLKKHNNIQTVYLINAALDISYITAGVFLRLLGSEKNDIRMKGYGSSLLLQGGYLMVYDLVQYILLKRNATKLFHANIPIRLTNHSSGLPGFGILYNLNK